jgi:hypothetical protein
VPKGALEAARLEWERERADLAQTIETLEALRMSFPLLRLILCLPFSFYTAFKLKLYFYHSF